MLLRYGTTADGRIVRKAKIYTRAEHGIPADAIDPDAVWAIRRLNEAGHRAYIVGGAIRDLLLGKKPKDFDVATDAPPNRIRRIFRRSRIIGRRFRLVHLYFEGGKIIEVSTFRAASSTPNGRTPLEEGPAQNANIYGTLAEDVMRRDYSLNALFYCPLKEQLIDYVDGLRDIRHRRLRILAPPGQSFAEDPVRMLRAAKYAAPFGLKIPLNVRLAIRRNRMRLLECSPDRLTEEFNKIMASGHSAAILGLARRLGLFDVLFPKVAALLATSGAEREFFARLADLDRRAAGGLERSEVLLAFYGDALRAARPEPTLAALKAAFREVAAPLRIPNREIASVAHRLVARRPARAAVPAAQGGPGAGVQRRRRRRRRPRAAAEGATRLPGGPAASVERSGVRRRRRRPQHRPLASQRTGPSVQGEPGEAARTGGEEGPRPD